MPSRSEIGVLIASPVHSLIFVNVLSMQLYNFKVMRVGANIFLLKLKILVIFYNCFPSSSILQKWMLKSPTINILQNFDCTFSKMSVNKYKTCFAFIAEIVTISQWLSVEIINTTINKKKMV